MSSPESLKQKVTEYVKYIIGLCGMYIIWITLHYFAAHAYVYLCVPGTIIGFLMAPFIIPAPHCQALRWLVYNGGNNIIAMWVMFGAWISSYLKHF